MPRRRGTAATASERSLSTPSASRRGARPAARPRPRPRCGACAAYSLPGLPEPDDQPDPGRAAACSTGLGGRLPGRLRSRRLGRRLAARAASAAGASPPSPRRPRQPQRPRRPRPRHSPSAFLGSARGDEPVTRRCRVDVTGDAVGQVRSLTTDDVAELESLMSTSMTYGIVAGVALTVRLTTSSTTTPPWPRPRRLADDLDRDVDGDGLVAVDELEVDVMNGAADGMALQSLASAVWLSPSTQVEQGVEAGGTGQGGAQFAPVDGHRDRVGAVAVDDAGDAARSVRRRPARAEPRSVRDSAARRTSAMGRVPSKTEKMGAERSTGSAGYQPKVPL